MRGMLLIALLALAGCAGWTPAEAVAEAAEAGKVMGAAAACEAPGARLAQLEDALERKWVEFRYNLVRVRSAYRHERYEAVLTTAPNRNAAVCPTVLQRLDALDVFIHTRMRRWV